MFKKYDRKNSLNKKKKVTKTVMILIFTFILSWFPVHFIATWYKLDENFPEGNVVFVIKLIAHTMSYSISTINPIIYARFSTKEEYNNPSNLQTTAKRSLSRCKNIKKTTANTRKISKTISS